MNSVIVLNGCSFLQVEHGEPSWVPSGADGDLAVPPGQATLPRGRSSQSDASDTDVTQNTELEENGGAPKQAQQSGGTFFACGMCSITRTIIC